MQLLNLERINSVAPYPVWLERKSTSYFFNTDHGVLIRVDFDEDEASMPVLAYWLSVVNVNEVPSPHDTKVMVTLWAIIDEFFRINNDVMLYMCDTANDQQEMRARLFRRWFNLFEGHDQFYFLEDEVPDEGNINYLALIVPKSYPSAKNVIEFFESEMQRFKSKP